MSEVVIIPSKELLPKIEEGIRNTLKSLPMEKIEIEKMEWVKEGIKVWIQKEK